MKPRRRQDAKLYRGNCLDVLRTLPDRSVDLVLTDPPYGHNNNNNGDLIHRWEAALGRLASGKDSPKGRPIANDGPEANELFHAVLPDFARLLRHGCCCCCCCGGGGPDPQFARWSLWLDQHLDFKQMVVWDKGPIGMGWHYRRSYETVLVAQKPGGACKWYDRTHKIENIIRPGYKGIKKIIPKATDHPTPKPIELARHFIELHTKRGDTVLDPFMGRGWVGQAALELGRRFIGIEISARHFRHAEKRIDATNAERYRWQGMGPRLDRLWGMAGDGRERDIAGLLQDAPRGRNGSQNRDSAGAALADTGVLDGT